MSNQTPPYKLLLVGLGRVGLKHLKAIKHNKDLFELVAIVDTQIERAAGVWREAKMGSVMPPVFTSVDALPVELKLDVAAICTPSGTHFPIAKDLLNKKIHCLIEKPLTLNYQEAVELKNLADKQEVKIALGYIYRFAPIVDLIQADVAEGKFGSVLSASVHVCWGHDQAYYDAAQWRGTWEQDGGVLMNQCIHALDLMTWLMNGKIITAQATIARQTHDMEAEDFGLVNYHLDNDTYLQLTGTTTTSKFRQRAEFTLLCEKAELRCGIHKKKPYFSLYDSYGKKFPGYLKQTIKNMLRQGFIRSLKAYINPHSGIYRDFANAIAQNRPARASAEAGCSSLAAILAAYASAKNSGAVSACPPEAFELKDMKNFFS